MAARPPTSSPPAARRGCNQPRLPKPKLKCLFLDKTVYTWDLPGMVLKAYEQVFPFFLTLCFVCCCVGLLVCAITLSKICVNID